MSRRDLAKALAGALLIASAGACTSGQVPKKPGFWLVAEPGSFSSNSTSATVYLEALDGTGSPVNGKATIFAPAGRFLGTTAPQIKTNIVNGQAQALYVCSPSEDPGCTGSLTLTASWNGKVATSTITFGSGTVATGGGGSGGGGGGGGSAGCSLALMPPCAVGASGAVLQGGPNDFIYPGSLTLTTGNWGTNSSSVGPDGGVYYAHVGFNGYWDSGVQDAGWEPESWGWDFEAGGGDAGLSSLQVPVGSVPPLQVGLTYQGAQRWGFNEPAPGFDVSGDHRGCSEETATFKIYAATVGLDDAGQPFLQSFAAAFEQSYCDGITTPLCGCVSYQAP